MDEPHDEIIYDGTYTDLIESILYLHILVIPVFSNLQWEEKDETPSMRLEI